MTGSLTEEQFDQARRVRNSMREKPKPRLEDAPPVPRLDATTMGVFNDAFSKLSTGTPREARIVFGRYYYAHGLSTTDCTIYRSFEEVLSDLADGTVQSFMRSLRGATLHDVCAQALVAYNNAIVVATAANYVMQYVAASDVIKEVAEPQALRQWAQDVRGEFVRANSRAQLAMEFLLATDHYRYLQLSDMHSKEQRAAEEFLNMLSLGMKDDDVETAYRASLPAAAFNPSGRYRLDVRPAGWRTRLAMACLGRKPGYIDMAITPAEEGGKTLPVYTSASELTLASRIQGNHI